MNKTQIQIKTIEKAVISKGIIGNADGVMAQFIKMVLQELTMFNFQKDGITILLATS